MPELYLMAGWRAGYNYGMPKQDLYFRQPILNAAGSLGFAPDVRQRLPWGDFGAFVTNPVSLRPRTPAARPGVAAFAGGFLLHSGLPNPGLPTVIKKYARRWAETDLPVIVHLMADRPEETARMVQLLEGLENVMAVELGFAPGLADDILVLAVELAQGELPLVACLPFEQQHLAASLMQAGASALSLAAPRGSLPAVGDGPHSGRMFGPALYPSALEWVRRLAGAGFPVIGAGGVYHWQQAQAMLDAGALAVQLDSVLWGLGEMIIPPGNPGTGRLPRNVPRE